MSINCDQLKDVIINPSLNAIGLFSDSACQLILGTCAQETLLCRYIIQTKIEPYKGGIGIYQMQPLTYDFIWHRHVEQSASMKAKIRLFLGYEGKPLASRMASDLALATIMCRLFYANILEKLPDGNDVKAMARYYKIYYNTKDGSATEEEFIQNYNEYVLGKSSC